MACLAKTDWIEGYPHKPESWPGHGGRSRLWRPASWRGSHNNLVDALGTRFVVPDAFIKDVRVPYRHNRLLLYRANLIHSATGYWGKTLAEKRMAAVFFWMA